jgi:hypothetical protein
MRIVRRRSVIKACIWEISGLGNRLKREKKNRREVSFLHKKQVLIRYVDELLFKKDAVWNTLSVIALKSAETDSLQGRFGSLARLNKPDLIN